VRRWCSVNVCNARDSTCLSIRSKWLTACGEDSLALSSQSSNFHFSPFLSLSPPKTLPHLPSRAPDTTAAVTAAMKVSTDINAIKTLLGAMTVDFSAIRTSYDANLKTLADADRTGEPIWDAFKAHFGDSSTFITEYFYLANTGTAAGFKHLESRKEMSEKTLVDMLVMHGVISLLYRGQAGSDKALW